MRPRFSSRTSVSPWTAWRKRSATPARTTTLSARITSPMNRSRARGTLRSSFGGADAQRAERATVRQVDVNLIGMSSRPDPGFVDAAVYSPAEGSATKNLRKLSLTQHIVPPNLGLKGKRHNMVPSIAIQPPASITVCTGHCQYFGVSWPASTTPGVTGYKLLVNAPAGANPLTDPAIVDEPHTVSGLSFVSHLPTAAALAF